MKQRIKKYIIYLALGLIMGIACGLCGVVFSKTVSLVTAFRQSNGWVLWLLPIGGLLSVFIYKLCKCENTGTTNVFECAQTEKGLPSGLPVAIFCGTAISHLFGASVGREGAAIQIGGGIANLISRAFKLDEKARRITVMCGMAALFSAVFGTPISACVFVIEVIMTSLCIAAAVPVLISSFTAHIISITLGVQPERFNMGSLPRFSALLVGKTVIIVIACIAVAFVFCAGIRLGKSIFKKIFKNEYIRIAAGGVIMILLTLAVGSRDYNGGGIDIIERVFEGIVRYEAFALKILFTVVCISAGYKGGEIVPTLFIGATLGGASALLLGLPIGYGAAVGIAVLFCAATKCPVAAILLCCEMLGFGCALFVVPVVIITFITARYRGLYGNSYDIIKILINKRKTALTE